MSLFASRMPTPKAIESFPEGVSSEEAAAGSRGAGEGSGDAGSTMGGHGDQRWLAGKSLWPWFFRDPVLAHLPVKRGGLQPQGRGGAVGAVDLAATPLQGLDDGTPLQFGETGWRRYRRAIRLGRLQPARVDLQGIPGGDDH